MLPVMINIVLINLIYVVAGGALLTSAFLLASIAALLWHDRRSLVEVFWSRPGAEPSHSRNLHRSHATSIAESAPSSFFWSWQKRSSSWPGAARGPSSKPPLPWTSARPHVSPCQSLRSALSPALTRTALSL